jgi:hypothetical protein
MSDIKIAQKDRFELEMDNKKEILQNCQSDKGLNSCFNCNELFNCQIRKDYVDAVYNSMSKGNVGDFDF